MKKNILFFVGALILCLTVKAAYLVNVPQVLVQPNGDTIHCFASGDEFYNWLHDANGYTIMQNAETGYFVYGKEVDGTVVATNFIVGKVNPQLVGLSPNAKISAKKIISRREALMYGVKKEINGTKASADRNKGVMNNIVIFISFAGDNVFTNSFSTIHDMFNDSTAGANSMYNYFKHSSYGQLSIPSYFYPASNENVVVSYQDVNPIGYFQPKSATNTIGYTDDESTDREFTLLENAVNFVKSSIPSGLNLDSDNDGRVDNVVFIVKGGVGAWGSLLWPHQWSIYDRNVSINGKRVYGFNLQLEASPIYFSVSTLCHEMFHSLGAPDLYHYGEGGDLSPVGSWDLMHSNGTPPQQMNAYMKFKYGNWIDEIPEISSCGTYSLKSLSASNTQNCYKIPTTDPKQFYMLEYRNQNDLFDESVPGSGLLIYRINENFNGNAGYNGTDVFDEVYLFRPRGTIVDDGNVFSAFFSNNAGRTVFGPTTDPKPFLTNGTVDADMLVQYISAAGGQSMSFTYKDDCPHFSVNPNILRFTGIADAESASVETKNLTENITAKLLSVNSDFLISNDSLTWANQVSLSKSGGKIYVKLKVAVAGTYLDTIAFYSAGAEIKYLKLVDVPDDTCAVLSFPYLEDFESGIPNCWSQEYIVGNADWEKYEYYTGYFCVLFKGLYLGLDSKTKLVSPAFDLRGVSATLNFEVAHNSYIYGARTYFSPLNVYYKNRDDAEWTLLKTCDEPSSYWQNITVNLPNLSGNYRLAFESYLDNYVLLDNVEITVSEVLPVELVSFSGKYSNYGNKLEWSTATEINNDYFILERKTAESDFKEIAKIKGAGNSNSLLNYYFVDDDFDGTAYYRLSQIDFDGKKSLFEPIVVKLPETESDFEIYPNPADEFVSVETNLSFDQLVISDLYGRTLKVISDDFSKINISDLERGTYFINLVSEDRVVSKMIVKK